MRLGDIMDDNDKNKLKDILSTIDPVEFKWDETNTSVGIIAQEIGPISGTDTITLSGSDGYSLGSGSIDMSTITIGPSNSSVYAIGSNGSANWSTVGSISSPGLSVNSGTGKNYIRTPKSEIDIDELADMMQTLKKRLLIIAPDFEKHEKYPMLKEMYDEYKAMESLLSGPDKSSEEM